MDEAFEQIALELRHQYSIGYRPQNFTGDGKLHRIKVKVTTLALHFLYTLACAPQMFKSSQ